MYVSEIYISAYYICVVGRAYLFITSIHPHLLLYNTQHLYFAQNTVRYYTKYVIKLLLRAILHAILKYSPKGGGFHPFHVLEIKWTRRVGEKFCL